MCVWWVGGLVGWWVGGWVGVRVYACRFDIVKCTRMRRRVHCLLQGQYSTAGESSSTGEARKLGRSALAESALIGEAVFR